MSIANVSTSRVLAHPGIRVKSVIFPSKDILLGSFFAAGRLIILELSFSSKMSRQVTGLSG